MPTLRASVPQVPGAPISIARQVRDSGMINERLRENILPDEIDADHRYRAQLKGARSEHSPNLLSPEPWHDTRRQLVAVVSLTRIDDTVSPAGRVAPKRVRNQIAGLFATNVRTACCNDILGCWTTILWKHDKSGGYSSLLQPNLNRPDVFVAVVILLVRSVLRAIQNELNILFEVTARSDQLNI